MIRLRNSSIDSPSLRELVTSSFEGKSVLKSQIVDSNMRMLQIKHGMAISEMIDKDAEILENLNPLSFREHHLTNRSSLTKMSSPGTIQDSKVLQSESRPSSIGHYQQIVMRQKIGLKPAIQSQAKANYARRKLAQTPVPASENAPLFKPDGVMYIPNYNSKHAKIIKMSDLAKAVNDFGDSEPSQRGS